MVGIKGMEMPECCFRCRFMHHRDFCKAKPGLRFTDKEYSELERRYEGCPLVEIDCEDEEDADEWN